MENWSILTEILQPEILQFVLVAVCTVIWFSIKRVIKKFDKITDKLEGVEKRLDDKVDSLRAEIVEQRHEYSSLIQELVRRETCLAYRAEIMRRIDRLQDVRGIAFTKSGAAFVNINDVEQMNDLYTHMTPEERQAHLARCQFRQGEDDGQGGGHD